MEGVETAECHLHPSWGGLGGPGQAEQARRAAPMEALYSE